MVTIKCDMCGKDTLNDDVCRECANKVEEFIKTSHTTLEEQEIINKCNREKCEGCESFNYTSSVIEPNELHVKREKRKRIRTVGLEHTVKPEDFYEED